MCLLCYFDNEDVMDKTTVIKPTGFFLQKEAGIQLHQLKCQSKDVCDPEWVDTRIIVLDTAKPISLEKMLQSSTLKRIPIRYDILHGGKITLEKTEVHGNKDL